MNTHKTSGYTLVELVVVMAIGSVVVSALLFFFSGSLASYRSQVGHIFATADARNQVQRMTDVIRNTQDNTSNDWLQEASDDAIAVYTDVEGDGVLEKVAYRRSTVNTNELVREVTIGGSTTSNTIMKDIANATDGTQPLFTYYDANGNSISTPANRTSPTVKNIGISVTVQSSDPSTVDLQTVATRITPRSKLQGDVSQITGPDATREVSIQLPSGNPPPANANTTIVTKNPDTNVTLSTKTISFAELNDGRLSIYANKLYAMVNYKTNTGLGNNEGWYVWISKSVPAISNLFQLPLGSLYTNQCLGVNWATVQASSTSSCIPLDTALYPISSSETFQPVITYTEGNYRDYVRDITPPVDNNWFSVTYGNGLFVAVSVTGTDNRVMTSPDGITWTIRASAADNTWFSVTYGNGLFVAVSVTGTDNRVMTSPDGITWTTRTPASNNNWRSVTYGNGLFVAVSSTAGTGNQVMTSPDGITWTSRTSAVDHSWQSVTYGNGLFVAVDSSGTGNQVMTSPDGITWTSRTSIANSWNWTSVTYGNGLFVAVTGDGVPGNQVMTSPDGITWTSRTSAANNGWRSVTYGNGLFVAVSNSGIGNRVMTSPNGITWTSRTSAVDHSWQSVTYGNGLFVAVSNTGTGNRVMTSPDGITWTSRTSVP